MKIFVSHSAYDRWAAGRICRELTELGFTTFLDEKDIQSGESIDTAVHSHLAESDELLILLSPASRESAWVFMEIGGAKALGKRIVPILLHVGANEIVAPLSQYLCRDINEIERYYDELKRREKVPTTVRRAPRRPKPKAAPPKITVGTVVRVKDAATIPEQSKRRHPVWIDEMSSLSGRELKVKESGDVLKLEGVDWGWLPEWLDIVH